MPSQLKSWDKALLHQVRMFLPSEEFLSHGRNIANKLLTVLHKHSKFSIDRAGIVGSIEKKTSLSIDVDYDFVVSINKVLPPFDEVFDDFEYVILRYMKNAKISSSYPKTRGSALNVTLDGLDFDIVPAVNFSQNAKVQRRRVMEEIRKLPCPAIDGYRYSSSLSQTAVGFIKRQTPFAHDVMRLAKFWNKTIFIFEGISGRSSLIELIATQVAKDEQLNASPSLYKAFISFLEKMKNLQNLKIIFYDYYDDSEIDESIERQRPLILDPANPYNNFGYAFIKKPSLMIQFCNYAQSTLVRLIVYQSNLLKDLVYVFAAQLEIPPRYLIMQYLPQNSSNSFIVGVTKRSRESFPNVIVHNKTAVNKYKLGVKILKHYLLKNAEVVNDRNLPDTENSEKTIQSTVQKVIDMNVLGKRDVSHWPPYYLPYDDDVTFEIPTGPALVTVHVKLEGTRRDQTTARVILLSLLIFLLVIVLKILDLF